MVKFGFKGSEVEFPGWSKHHKTMGVHVKRDYEDGEVVELTKGELKARVSENEEQLIPRHVNLYNWETGESRGATDYYLPFQNMEYIEPVFDHYGVGSSNTSQTTYIRFKFLLGYDLFILDYSYTSEGSFATSFHDLISSSDYLEEIIEEILEKGEKLEDVGIERSKGDDEEEYTIVVARDGIHADHFDVGKRELFNSLIGIEIYKHDMEIN